MTDSKSVTQTLAEAFTEADSLDAPLDARLRLYLSASRGVLPDLEEAYDRLVTRVAAQSDAEHLLPGIGEQLPNFLMTDTSGELVELESLLAKGPLVISFNRGP